MQYLLGFMRRGPISPRVHGTLDYLLAAALIAVLAPAAPALARRPIPGTTGGVHVWNDQLPDDMSERLEANRSLFPRGVDLLLVSADQIAALPRSVRVCTEEARPCT